MGQKLRKDLITYFEAPKPQRKYNFIRKFGMQKMGLISILRTQFRYISKWIWVISVLFYVISFYITAYGDTKLFGFIFAFVPFLVLLSITESMRSYRYGMEELELSTRFSLKYILLARMLILGLGNIVTLLISAYLFREVILTSMVYIMVIYFITTSGSLYIVRKNRGSEGTFICFAFSATVSLLELSVPWKYEILVTSRYLIVLFLFCMIGIFFTIRESYRIVRMAEEFVWN